MVILKLTRNFYLGDNFQRISLILGKMHYYSVFCHFCPCSILFPSLLLPNTHKTLLSPFFSKHLFIIREQVKQLSPSDSIDPTLHCLCWFSEACFFWQHDLQLKHRTKTNTKKLQSWNRFCLNNNWHLSIFTCGWFGVHNWSQQNIFPGSLTNPHPPTLKRKYFIA